MTIPHFDITYDPKNGMSFADANVETMYQTMMDPTKPSVKLNVSSMLLITRYRVGVVENECTVNLIYNDIVYPVEPNGYVDWWNEVPDYSIDLLLRLSKA